MRLANCPRAVGNFRRILTISRLRRGCGNGAALAKSASWKRASSACRSGFSQGRGKVLVEESRGHQEAGRRGVQEEEMSTAGAGRVLVIGRSTELVNALKRESEVHRHGIDTCDGAVEALHRLQSRAADVVVTDPDTSLGEDVALCALLRERRPGVKVIALAPAVAPDDVIAALRAHVFACYTRPFDLREIVDMVRAALGAGDWHDGIEVVSGAPHWLTLRVSCRLLTADRLVRFMTELQSGVVDDDSERNLLLTAFREMLLNAMEHGGGFDPEQVIEVTAALTARA